MHAYIHTSICIYRNFTKQFSHIQRSAATSSLNIWPQKAFPSIIYIYRVVCSIHNSAPSEYRCVKAFSARARVCGGTDIMLYGKGSF